MTAVQELEKNTEMSYDFCAVITQPLGFKLFLRWF